MIYIDGYSHGIITHTGNKNIILNFEENDIVKLLDPAKIRESVIMKQGCQAYYDSNLKDVMFKYNNDTLELDKHNDI